MVKTITARKVREYWANRQEIAVLDVREEGPYAISHPLFALSVPVSEVEVKLPALVPRLSTPIVVYDNGERYVSLAAERILAMGYRDVAILEGGLAAYALVGEVYRDVNVPSKAFGELVEAIRHTPSLPASEIKNVLENDQDVVVLDARRYEEYHTMSIPRGQSCPGGELVYRIFEVAPNPDTTVIVHCAGRTRSIVGTQSLVNAGIRNKVVALENGTIGWTLAGFTLNGGEEQRAKEPSADSVQKARRHAGEWARHVGVSVIDTDQLVRFAKSADSRTLYLLDVRDPREYTQGHPDGFISAPGGQLVQATDEWVGVRGARIVLYDTDGVRALMAASWLVQLGWEVHVLKEGALVPSDLPRPLQPVSPKPSTGSISVDDLETLSGATIVDLARSPAYRKGHIPGAWFTSGPELVRDIKSLPGSGPVVLTSPDGRISSMNTEHVRKHVADSSREILYLNGGTEAWKASGRPLETDTRWISEPIDVYKRPYEGTENAEKDMKGYIEWEHGLVAQLANDSVACFHVVRGMPDST